MNAFLNLYAPSSKASKYIEKTLTRLQGTWTNPVNFSSAFSLFMKRFFPFLPK